jgi:hypothetical protein
MESRVMKNLANTENRAKENSTNTESRVTEDSSNLENRVMQDSGGGARNQKKENVLLQAKGQLHGGTQVVLPRHKMQIAKDASKRVGREKRRGRAGLLV